MRSIPKKMLKDLLSELINIIQLINQIEFYVHLWIVCM